MNPFILGILMTLMLIAVIGEVAYTVAIWMQEREDMRQEELEEERRERRRHFAEIMKAATIV